MGTMPPALKKYWASKRTGGTVSQSKSGHPMVPMSPQMMGAIKQSPKGKIPAGLAKYLANKAGK